jgi:hypothetical protein
MIGISYFRSIIFGFTIALALGAQAEETTAIALDEILLKNGSRILGTVTSARDGVVVIETDFAGALTIDAATVEAMHTNGSMVLQLADGNIIRDQPILMKQEGMVVTTDSGDQRSYGMSDILLVNPEPWELGDGYKPTGLISFAWALERGNSETDELDYKLESTWRSLEDRYNLRMAGEVDEANGLKSADNWAIIGKYDYFLKGDNYWGGKIGAEQDKFADLDLRAYAGPYYGRQFYDQPVFMLRADAGLAYVSEDFVSAEDQEYPGANWDIQINSNYLGGSSQLYINHDGIWNLKDTQDIILNTTFGLSFPLLGSLEGAAEILLEYDSGAVEGIEELDQTYKFRIGYTW